MEGILMMGPRQWGIDHMEWLKDHPFTAIQYSARNLDDALDRLPRLARPFSLFIYTPRKYRNVPDGSGEVEFACRVLEYRASHSRTISPWPTLDGAKPYDDHPDFKYEFWFKVDLVQKCSIPVTKFVYHWRDGRDSTPRTLAEFSGPARRKILFVSSDFQFDAAMTDLAARNLATEEITHGNPQSIPDEEGRKRIAQHVTYERSAKNRRQAIQIHGTICSVCGFSFNSFYGADLAREYIEVHHLVPLAQESGTVDPAKDLICVCSNCHSMLHRRTETLVPVDELKDRITKYSGAT